MARPLQHPQLHHPQLQHPQLQHPQLQHPHLQHPQLQLQHPQQLQQQQQQQHHQQHQLQQHQQPPPQQQQQRFPPMSLIPAKPFMGQGIPIEHQQRVQPNPYLQQQYFYGGQTQPIMEVMCNPTSWYPQQDHLHQQYHLQNNQIWYGMPYVNSPKVFYPKSPIPGIISPSINQHPNGAHKQPTTKARSRPASKDQGQSSAEQGRSIAGGRSLFVQKSSADYCLNRNRSISSLQHNKESRSKQTKDNNQLKTVPSKEELAKPQEETKEKEKEQQQEKAVVKKEVLIEKEEEPSVGFFRRLATFRSRSAKKSKNRKNENGSNDIATQLSSSSSSAKKHGFLSRLFGGVDSSNLSNIECLTEDPASFIITKMDQIEIRDGKCSKKLQAPKESTIV
ncbi:putative mediator of RNA polymerase II transcription subunit 26 [Drosophila serrata]|uniref:putative mediator of RNA polymerase II transcription subunit 26 n=1 Tax=Drosophila serrata TaxID=7274 RepID=UPI000A1D13A5|nr:putative mediator of RNA polymerase II transcription subunit 26 [Drosophila serrata]KAH8356986.1 hypothetical protein KR200_011061 [Drosophila serrata]